MNAQFNLGSLYFDGQGTDKDRAAGVNWYSQAADSGHGGAAMLMADFFQKGSSVNKDLVQAHAWASMAIKADHEEGQALQQKIESKLSSSQLSEAKRLYARWQIQ